MKVVIVGGVALIAYFRAIDDSFVDDERYTNFNRTFNVYEDVTEVTNTTKTNIENMEEANFGLLGVLGSLYNQAWQFLRLLITSLSFMGTALLGLTSIFGVPAWVVALISAIIVTLIGFAIFSIIFQRKT